MLFEVRAGSHYDFDKNKIYGVGDVVESDRDLESVFPNKFARMPDADPVAEVHELPSAVPVVDAPTVAPAFEPPDLPDASEEADVHESGAVSTPADFECLPAPLPEGTIIVPPALIAKHFGAGRWHIAYKSTGKKFSDESFGSRQKTEAAIVKMMDK